MSTSTHPVTNTGLIQISTVEEMIRQRVAEERARLEKEDMLEALAIEMIERKALDLILESAEYTDVPLGHENEEPAMTTSEQQAVPGEMKDVNAPPEETPANPS